MTLGWAIRDLVYVVLLISFIIIIIVFIFMLLLLFLLKSKKSPYGNADKASRNSSREALVTTRTESVQAPRLSAMHGATYKLLAMATESGTFSWRHRMTQGTCWSVRCVPACGKANKDLCGPSYWPFMPPYSSAILITLKTPLSSSSSSLSSFLLFFFSSLLSFKHLFIVFFFIQFLLIFFSYFQFQIRSSL